MENNQRSTVEPQPRSEEELREAARLLRGWMVGIWRGLPVVLPIATAIGGAFLLYFARISEESYLRKFGLSADQFGGKSPDISKIVFPALLISLWITHAFYKGLTHPETKSKVLEAGFRRLFIRGDGRTMAARFILFFGIAPALVVFSFVHWSAFWHGRFRADSVVYRVAYHGCAEDCVLYEKVSEPKKMANGEIGIPVISGDGRTAAYTRRGIVIIKNDELQAIKRVKVPNAKPKDTSILYDVLFKYMFN